MESIITISHGRPTPSEFSLIAVPRIQLSTGKLVSITGQYTPIKLVCPKTGLETNAEIRDMLRFSFTDDNEANLCSFHAKLAYGINGKQLFNALLKKDPNFNGEVDFLLITERQNTQS